MTENAETYILAFGGTILKEYKGVYLVSFPYNRDEIRYAVVKYHYYSTGRNGFDPIPLFDVTISEKQAKFFSVNLPAMYRFCEDEFRKRQP
ncbi:MAG: hypothetical protein IJK31_08385 [Ruminococcus sp.]|nr:hypothetical protein [Ruminococcus sp.]